MSILSRLVSWLRAEDMAEAEVEDEMFERGETRVIVGLGNPGKEYAATRHNAGWMVIDDLARRWNAPTSKKRMHAQISEVRRNGDRMVLVMPQTYMNESGRAVREILGWYKVKPENCLVVVDDLDIPFGQLRVRPNGSAGGHNGLKSIFRDTGTQEFPRVRVGIGRPKSESGHTIGHVLSRFNADEQAQLPKVIDAASDAVEQWLDEGLLATMNAINGLPSVIE